MRDTVSGEACFAVLTMEKPKATPVLIIKLLILTIDGWVPE